ncbi:MAG: hypothetical protein WC663_03175 [Patescibacteria group bacterium]|jgi:hypothetical protein
MKIKKILALIPALIILIFPFFSQAYNIQDYIKTTYNRYSKHFDKNGWHYNQPNYSIDNKYPNTAREWSMFASYYYNRLDNQKTKIQIKAALNNAILELQARPTITQSFNDSIAHYLIYQQKNLFSKEEKEIYYSQVKESLFARVNINDSENRGIIAGVLDSYLANKLYFDKQIDRQQYKFLIKRNKQKISKSINQCIDENDWYFEGDQKYFSTHYHVLSAYLLMFYSDYFNNEKYLDLSKKMTSNIRKLTFQNGFIEAKIGMRPIGLGAQTYLMLGILNKRFNHKDYSVYLNYVKPRFFNDKASPNRLEFHSTMIDTEPNYHDDIGFSLIAEISKNDNKIINTKFKKEINRINLKNNSYQDKRFTIKNNGGIIIINNKEYQLATNGDYSRIFTIK